MHYVAYVLLDDGAAPAAEIERLFVPYDEAVSDRGTWDYYLKDEILLVQPSEAKQLTDGLDEGHSIYSTLVDRTGFHRQWWIAQEYPGDETPWAVARVDPQIWTNFVHEKLDAHRGMVAIVHYHR